MESDVSVDFDGREGMGRASRRPVNATVGQHKRISDLVLYDLPFLIILLRF